jgi:hypothetical protein
MHLIGKLETLLNAIRFARPHVDPLTAKLRKVETRPYDKYHSCFTRNPANRTADCEIAAK